MNQEIKNKVDYLLKLKANPFADLNYINRLKRDLEWANTAGFTTQERQLLNKVFY